MERGNIPRRRNLWYAASKEERFPEGEKRRGELKRYEAESLDTVSTRGKTSRLYLFFRYFRYTRACILSQTLIGPMSVGAAIKDTQIFSNKFRVHVDRSTFRMFEPNKITVDKQRKTEEGRRGMMVDG